MKSTLATALVLALGLTACALDGEEFNEDEESDLALAEDFEADVHGDIDGQMVADTIYSATVSNGHGTATAWINMAVGSRQRKTFLTDNCSPGGTQWRVVYDAGSANGVMPSCGSGAIGSPAGYGSLTRILVFNTATGTWTQAISH